MTTRKTTRKKARKARRTPAQKAATRKMIAAAKRARAAKKRATSLRANKRKAAKRKTAKKSHKRVTHKRTAKRSHKRAHSRLTDNRRKKARKGHKRASKRATSRKRTTRRSGAKKATSRRRHTGPIFMSGASFMRNKTVPKGSQLRGMGAGGGVGYSSEDVGEAIGGSISAKEREHLARVMAAKTPGQRGAQFAAYKAARGRSPQELAEEYMTLDQLKARAESAAKAASTAAASAATTASEAGATDKEKKAAAKAQKEADKAAKAAAKAEAAETKKAAAKAAKEAKAAEKKAKADAAEVKAAKWHRLMPRRIKDRVGFKYGKHTSLVAKVGKHKFPTYVYETKKGTLRHFSPSQLVGAKIGDKRPEVAAAIEALKAHRVKAAKTSPFIPNRKHAGAHVISFAQWKKMKPNVYVGGKGKYNRRRHQIAQTIYNELKRHGAKHERRLRPAALAYVTSFVSHGPKKHNNITRKTAVRDVKEVQSFLGIHRFPSFGNINKPFKFKRNPGMATFAQTVKAAAPLTGGFAAALALTKLVGDQLSSALAGSPSTSDYAKYSKLVSAAVVPAVGAAITTRIDAIPSKNEVAAGMVAAGILGVIKQGLGLAGQEKAAEYLSGLGASNVNYTNARGSALPNYLQGVGSYYMTSGVPAATAGLGAYYLTSGVPAQPTSGFGATPTFEQAAAGMGALPAGPGPVIAQAAAGMGEYFAPRGVSGLGQYEDKGISQAAAGLGLVKEGIMPNTQAAERALQFAEAAAGLGDLPLVSTNEPVDTYVPVDDAPEGSRAGVFTGGDGIFG